MSSRKLEVLRQERRLARSSISFSITWPLCTPQALNSVCGTLKNAKGWEGDSYQLRKLVPPTLHPQPPQSSAVWPSGPGLCVHKESLYHWTYEGTQLGVGSIKSGVQKDSVQQS